MARPENPIASANTAVAAFAEDLRRLRSDAGSPTYRELARYALFSASVLSSAASGQRLPSLQVTLAFVAACGGDREAWRNRWLQLAMLTGGEIVRERRQPEASTPRPAQLPSRQGLLIGCRPHLEHRIAPGTSTVVVSGPPGTGRRAFALDLAHRLAREAPDGQLYADLGHVTGASLGTKCVMEHFLVALGISLAEQPLDLEKQAELYRSILAERRLVVLLVNAGDEHQVRPFVGESTTSTTLVVSTRRMSGLPGAVDVPLGRFTRAGAAAIVARAFDVRQDGPLVAQVAELCADMPLAIDVTLRKLVGTSRPLDAAVAALADPSRALRWLDHHDLSVREALLARFRSVDPEAQSFLVRIAREKSLSAAATRLETEAEITDHLVEAGLVRHGAGGDLDVDRLVRALVLAEGRPLPACGRIAHLPHARAKRSRSHGAKTSRAADLAAWRRPDTGSHT
ncbi:hypothetical protein Cfla_3633 [Cellulomonas flavigena DSM 20109]|uniref:Uncharacterized protein n=1 Tax=Cellulomonas flavigena (strain ATCC 482 / DSM 20109 / BCRC 11376 / JCM 18109 / NBRC 3775 / NCIMB 8073 / NRS 134) TaxID=446466 RepID=D5UE28_CELFN|nr:hypothetical protein [Cellulomonas flavigena]ADG76504.1 hypothetical protein Cfla_3633 [Cellulomonas flavigena DSM 20109]